jgi:hypothetical protein
MLPWQIDIVKKLNPHQKFMSDDFYTGKRYDKIKSVPVTKNT